MATQTQTRRILIKVDTGESKALNEIAERMGLLNKNTKSLSDNMKFLTNAFKGWLGFLGVRELVHMSDEMQNLFNRLKLTTGSIEGATIAMQGLAGVADRTNQSLAEVGSVYARFAVSLKSSGASTKELLALTETLINSFRVSGANASETANAMVQLSQAFSVGVLRGQDLRSVLEQNATLATLLKQRYGADLFEKAKEGAISTTEVLKILSKAQVDINTGASKLAPTFEQTLTKAMNRVSISIGELNKNFELSAKFASLVGFAMDNLATILTLLGGVITIVAITRIPQMIEALSKLRLAFIGFSASNPVLLAITALAVTGALIYENWEKVSNTLTKARATFLDLAADVEEKGLGVRQALADATGSKTLQDQIDLTKKGIDDLRLKADQLRNSAGNSYGPKGPTEAEQMQANLDSLTKKLAAGVQPTKKIKEILGELNSEFLDGKISLEEYQQKLLNFDLYKFTREFKEGKYDIFKFHMELYKFDLAALNRAFDKGTLSLEEYKKGFAEIRVNLLNEQLDAGVISLAKYTSEITKLDDKFRPGASFYTGIEEFIASAGTLSEGIAKTTSQAFSHLSDTITGFIQKGKFDFAGFTKAVLDDITAMVVRVTIVKPIAEGILGLIGAGFQGGVGAAPAAGGTGQFGGLGGNYHFANGGIMSSMGKVPLNMYAGGGIAHSPQISLFGEGRRPEAYVPLPDGKSIPVTMQGSGGVNVTQTIIIQGDGSSSSTDSSDSQKGKQLGDMIKRVTLDTIIQQRRPGGVLS